jgi:hypothetical protein
VSARSLSAAEHPLSEVEFAALKQLSKSFARGTIVEQISGRLIRLGYAKEFMSNLIITDEGLSRLAIGNGRGSRE